MRMTLLVLAALTAASAACAQETFIRDTPASFGNGNLTVPARPASARGPANANAAPVAQGMMALPAVTGSATTPVAPSTTAGTTGIVPSTTAGMTGIVPSTTAGTTGIVPSTTAGMSGIAPSTTGAPFIFPGTVIGVTQTVTSSALGPAAPFGVPLFAPRPSFVTGGSGSGGTTSPALVR